MKGTVGKVRIYLTLQVIKCGPKTLSPAAIPMKPTENWEDVMIIIAWHSSSQNMLLQNTGAASWAQMSYHWSFNTGNFLPNY